MRNKKEIAVVVGYKGILGPVWCDVCEGLGYKVCRMGLPGCDIGIQADVDSWVANLVRAEGVPSVIVLNAAIDNPPGSEAKFHGHLQRIIDVNLLGNVRVVDALLPFMLSARGEYVIVPVVSIQGFVGADWRNYPPGFEKPVAYNMSKAALMQYARSLTVQYGRYGVRACCIGFGAVESEKLPQEFLDKYLPNVPLGRPVSKESAAAALRFALTCADFAGQTVLVDGGYTVW